MAFTLKARFTATIIDELNVEALCSTYCLIDPMAAFSTVVTTFYAWLAALDAVTAGRIVRGQVVTYPDLPALKGSPAADSRVSETGLLNFTGPTSPRRDAVAIPALADSLIDANHKIIADSGVVATFITLEQTGGSSLEFSTSDWDAPLTFKDSALTFREHNKQLGPASFVLK